jgi:hypothetical protein
LKVSAAESDEAQTPTTIELFATYSDGHVSRVRLIFRSGLWVRWSPAHSDSEAVRKADYDWSGVPELRPGPDFYETYVQERKKWTETGLCPDPHVYVVQESPWAREISQNVAGSERYRHYLVLGHDAYAEVLAEDWKVEQ